MSTPKAWKSQRGSTPYVCRAKAVGRKVRRMGKEYAVESCATPARSAPSRGQFWLVPLAAGRAHAVQRRAVSRALRSPVRALPSCPPWRAECRRQAPSTAPAWDWDPDVIEAEVDMGPAQPEIMLTPEQEYEYRRYVETEGESTHQADLRFMGRGGHTNLDVMLALWKALRGTDAITDDVVTLHRVAMDAGYIGVPLYELDADTLIDPLLQAIADAPISPMRKGRLVSDIERQTGRKLTTSRKYALGRRGQALVNPSKPRRESARTYRVGSYFVLVERWAGSPRPWMATVKAGGRTWADSFLVGRTGAHETEHSAAEGAQRIIRSQALGAFEAAARRRPTSPASVAWDLWGGTPGCRWAKGQRATIGNPSQSRRAWFRDIVQHARTLPWHEFVLEYVAHKTLSAAERAYVGGMQVKRAARGWTWGLVVGGQYRPSFAPTDASTAYGYLFRTPLSYFAREADDARTAILSARGNPGRAARGRRTHRNPAIAGHEDRVDGEWRRMPPSLTEDHWYRPEVIAARGTITDAIRRNEYLGQGNFGLTYRAGTKERPMAVKVAQGTSLHRRPWTRQQQTDNLMHEAGVANQLRAMGYQFVPESVYAELEDSTPGIVREYGEPVKTLTPAQFARLETDLYRMEDETGWRAQDTLSLYTRPDGSVFVGDVGIWQPGVRGRKRDHLNSNLPNLLNQAAKDYLPPGQAEAYYPPESVKNKVSMIGTGLTVLPKAKDRARTLEFLSQDASRLARAVAGRESLGLSVPPNAYAALRAAAKAGASLDVPAENPTTRRRRK